MDEKIDLDILVVDDKPENLLAMEALLEAPDVNIVKATSGNEALGLMLEHDFALVLLDVQMPEMDGFEIAELMRGSERTKHIPIIFVTAISKREKHIFKGYEKGAVDYLFKPVNQFMLKSKVNTFLQLHKQKKSLEATAQALKVTITELEESKRTIEDQNRILNELSIHDGLTGLYNHRHMVEILENEFNRARRYGSDLSCLLIDLDHFKEVNDRLGHPFGDFVLRELSERLKCHLRGSDSCFRYGGEEFLILLPQTDIAGAQTLAEKIREHCDTESYTDGVHSRRVTVSIGVASIKKQMVTNPEELIGHADKALYRAKAEGRNRVIVHALKTSKRVFDGDDTESVDIKYLKEHLSSVLEKTKKSAISSLELLVRDTGGTQLRNRSKRVLRYVELIGDRLNLPPAIIDTFKRATLLHDCFKILLGEMVMIEKAFLSEEEKQLIKHHPYMMIELTELFEFFSDEKSVLLHHHENFDGSGYPEGIKGNQIPLGARIFGMADAFVAMTSERAYRETLTVENAVEELAENAGSQFDPMLTSLFIDIIEKNEETAVSGETVQKAKDMIMQFKDRAVSSNQ